MEALFQPFQPTLTRSGLKRFGLSVQWALPSRALASIVHLYLQITATEPAPYIVIPDGTQALYISSDSSRVGGTFSRTFEVPILQPGEYFGIWFRPGALRRLFDIDASEIRNQIVDHKYLPCREFWPLHQRLYELGGFSERIHTCERWLLMRDPPRQPTPIDHALSLIYELRGDLKITQLERALGLSGRHINRLFQIHTGLSTKAFAQVVRVQHACRDLYDDPHGSTETALRAGFFDQSHLLRDFRRHLGTTPKEFFERFRSV